MFRSWRAHYNICEGQQTVVQKNLNLAIKYKIYAIQFIIITLYVNKNENVW